MQRDKGKIKITSFISETMKTKIYLLGSLLSVGLLTTSCAEDFLDLLQQRRGHRPGNVSALQLCVEQL